jgi:hypothetical protein
MLEVVSLIWFSFAFWEGFDPRLLRFSRAFSDFALVVVMLVLVATVAIPVVVPMAMMVPVVMLMMPTIMIPMSMPALDTMHYAAGDALAGIPLCQGRCASRQHDSGGGGK